MGLTELRDRLEDSRPASWWGMAVGFVLFVPAGLSAYLGDSTSPLRWIGLLTGLVAAAMASWGRRNLREIRDFEHRSGADGQSIGGPSEELDGFLDRTWVSVLMIAVGVMLFLLGLAMILLPGSGEPKNLVGILLAALGGAIGGIAPRPNWCQDDRENDGFPHRDAS